MLKKIFLLSLSFVLFFCFFIGQQTSAAKGQLIIINKSSNELAFYENNKLKRTFSVATGRSNNLTPEGSFMVVNKIVNRPYYKDNIPGGDPRNPLGNRWLGLNARGTWGSTYAIHGNNNPSSIGTYASAGCVRMHNDEIKWLFDQVEVNTPVIIVSSTSSFDHIAKAHGHSVTTTTIGSAPALTATLLRLGSRSDEVRSLQETLVILGYDPGEISGYFHEQTDAAVKKFQSDNNLTVDGIVGPATKRVLRKMPEKPVSSAPTEKEEQ